MGTYPARALPDPTAHLDGLAEVERGVLAAVAGAYGLTPHTLVSRNRTEPVREARWVAMGLFYRLGYARTAIGRVLQRDHSTVHYGLERIEGPVAELVDRLADELALPPLGGWTRLVQERAIRAGTAGLPEGEALAHYLLADVLGWRRVESSRSRRALFQLSAHPWLVRSCTRLLAQTGLGAYGSILARQVAAMQRR